MSSLKSANLEENSSSPLIGPQAFSSIFWSLLTYYKTGTRETFFRGIVYRAAQFTQLNLDADEMKKLQYYLYRRMQDFGFIEVIKDGASKWSVLDNGVVPFSPGQALIFGDECYKKNVLQGLGGGSRADHKLCSTYVRGGDELVLSLPCIRQVDVPRQHDSEIHRNWGADIEKVLPSIKTGADRVLERMESASPAALFHEIVLFDFIEFRWKKSNVKDLSQGLFRAVFENDRSSSGQLYLLIDRESTPELFRVNNHSSDWAYFLAASLMHQKLCWKYSAAKEHLFLQVDHIKLLPGLVRRMLCSASMSWPIIERDCYVFEKIKRSHVKQMMTQYAFIEIKDV